MEIEPVLPKVGYKAVAKPGARICGDSHRVLGPGSRIVDRAPEETPYVYGVADGRGGGSLALAASKNAFAAFRKLYEPDDESQYWSLEQCVLKGQEKVEQLQKQFKQEQKEAASDPGTSEWYKAQQISGAIGSTLSVIGIDRVYTPTEYDFIVNGELYHVGDSRVYHFHYGEQCLEQITTDHVEKHNNLRYLDNYLGAEVVRYEHKNIRFFMSDSFILMTDGIYDSLPDERLEAITREYDDRPQVLCDKVIQEVGTRADDDMTIIAVHLAL